MQVSKVSFGTLVAVFGTPKKIRNIDKRLSSAAMIKDVTSTFQFSFPSGTLAQAARRGDQVKLYITGKERNLIESEKTGWKTPSNLLENVQDYFDGNKMSVGEVVEHILKHN